MCVGGKGGGIASTRVVEGPPGRVTQGADGLPHVKRRDAGDAGDAHLRTTACMTGGARPPPGRGLPEGEGPPLRSAASGVGHAPRTAEGPGVSVHIGGGGGSRPDPRRPDSWQEHCAAATRCSTCAHTAGAGRRTRRRLAVRDTLVGGGHGFGQPAVVGVDQGVLYPPPPRGRRSHQQTPRGAAPRPPSQAGSGRAPEGSNSPPRVVLLPPLPLGEGVGQAEGARHKDEQRYIQNPGPFPHQTFVERLDKE